MLYLLVSLSSHLMFRQRPSDFHRSIKSYIKMIGGSNHLSCTIKEKMATNFSSSNIEKRIKSPYL